MRAVQMLEWPPGCKPFEEDPYHMGTQIGSNCFVMMPNYPTEVCKYLIVVDTVTGSRIRIEFDEEAQDGTRTEA